MTRLLRSVNNASFITNLIFLCLGVSLLAVGIVINKHNPPPSAFAQNNWHSAAFRGRQISDPLELPSKANAIKITTSEYYFKTSITEPSTQIRLWFFYTCEPKCQQLWLSLINDANEPEYNLLLEHPIIQKLHWFHIEDNGLRLYQKDPIYKTVKEFLASPANSTLLTEQSIVKLYPLNRDNLTFFDNTSDIGKAENILTTYSFSSARQDWIMFSRSLSVPAAKQQPGSILKWRISQQYAGENPPTLWIAQLGAALSANKVTHDNQ
jgi:hypothetical protein